MSWSARAKNLVQVAKGKLERSTGRATGNDQLRLKGQFELVKGRMHQATQKVRDALR